MRTSVSAAVPTFALRVRPGVRKVGSSRASRPWDRHCVHLARRCIPSTREEVQAERRLGRWVLGFVAPSSTWVFMKIER